MKLVSDWDRVLRHAWSVRLDVLTSVLGYAAAALPYLQGYVSPKTALVILATTSLAKPLVRIIKQRSVSDGDSKD